LSYELRQNFPNPFAQETTIEFVLPVSQKVTLQLFDIKGRLVQTLLNETRPKGYQTLRFNAGRLSNGIYYLKMETAEFSAIRKVVLQR
jgi:hypothetical protein